MKRGFLLLDPGQGEDLGQHSFLAAIKLVKRGIFSVPTRFSDRFKTSGLKNLDLDRNDISFDEGVTSHMPVSREVSEALFSHCDLPLSYQRRREGDRG